MCSAEERANAKEQQDTWIRSTVDCIGTNQMWYRGLISHHRDIRFNWIRWRNMGSMRL